MIAPITPPCTGPGKVHRLYDEGPDAEDRAIMRCVWCSLPFRVSRVGGSLHVALDLMSPTLAAPVPEVPPVSLGFGR